MTAASVVATAARVGRHPRSVFLARRLARFGVSVFILVTATFFMVHAIPGDPVRAALGIKAPAQVVAATTHRLGLDQPVWHQYMSYLHHIFTGHLENSLTTGLPVRQLLSQLIPPTAELALGAFALTIALSIPIGLLVGIGTREGKGRRLHLAFGSVTGVFLSIPDFLLGVVLVFIFAVTLHALPVAGQSRPSSYILPIVALAAGPVALLARIVRVETQRVLGEEYIRTARAKRLPARIIYLRHAFPNVLTATLTVSGLILSSLLAGTVLVETVFAWPGIGADLVQSVLNKDFPIVQATALFFGSAVLLINLVVDIVIGMVDPSSTIRES